MALTTADEVREWVGDAESDASIEAAVDRYDGDPLLAARSILRRRLANLAANPGRLNVEGDYSREWMQWQLGVIEGLIAQVEAETDDDENTSALPAVTTGLLTRDGPLR